METGPGQGNLRLDSLILPDSYVVQFKTRTFDLQGVSGVGIYANWSTWDNWVGIAYKPGRFYINEYINGYVGQHYVLDVHSDADPTEWHQLKFIKDGLNCRLYFDGDLIFSYQLPVPISGGYLVLTCSPGVHQFDNVKVRPLPSMD